MSLTTRHSSILIGLASRLANDTPALVSEEAQVSNEGWDTLTQIYTTRRAALTPETTLGLFPLGSRLGSRNWWITGAVPTERAPGFWTISVTFKGWAATKPTKITVGSAADQQGGEAIRAPASVGDTVGATYAKLQTHENMPTITASYLVEDISGSNNKSDKVGTAQTPPITLAVAATVWTWLSIYTYHWPNGWVLLSHEQDRLPGATAAQVTDTYKYVREKTPG